MRQFRIFLASPGDVLNERRLVRDIIQQLRNELRFRDRLNISLVAWDEPGFGVALEAGLTPQEAIKRALPQPKECDLVVVILWMRIGTPLPPRYKKPDGSRYRSGTEWEFLNGLEGFRKQGSPSVWLYHRTEAPAVALNDPDFESKRKQWTKLQDFLKPFSNDDGSIEISVNKYGSDDDFRRVFEQQLRNKLDSVIEGSPQTANSITNEARYKEVTSLLENFFQPISNRLKKDTAIWRGIKRDQDAPESIEYKTAFALEMNQVIPNHKEIVAIIERWRHLVDEDKELSEILDQYIRHVSAFVSIRDAGEKWKFPELLGHPWPKQLIPTIEARLKDLQNERKKLEAQVG